MVLKCDLKTVENECSSFSLLEPLVGILLIWKLNLPKDILGMEINTVIRGWERDQMRIWQDVRVKMDLLKLDSLLKDTQWSSKETSYLHVMHWEQAPPFQKGVTPWEWHDSCLLRPRSAKRNRNAQKKNWFAHWEETVWSAQNIYLFCFCALGCSRDSFKPFLCEYSAFLQTLFNMSSQG